MVKKAVEYLAKGIEAEGRSKSYKRRGVFAVKKKNGELRSCARDGCDLVHSSSADADATDFRARFRAFRWQVPHLR